MSLKMGGKIDKSSCFLPIWWVKVVFLLVLSMLQHMCKGNLCQFWPPSGHSLCKRYFYKYIPLTTPLTIFFFWYDTNMYIYHDLMMYIHSTWSGKHFRRFNRILEYIFRNLNIQVFLDSGQLQNLSIIWYICTNFLYFWAFMSRNIRKSGQTLNFSKILKKLLFLYYYDPNASFKLVASMIWG